MNQEYADVAIPYLKNLLETNNKTYALVQKVVSDVKAGRSLFVYGTSHLALLPLELYHRVGGPSFVIPLVTDFLLPTDGSKLVRFMEGIPASAKFLLSRAQPHRGEMVWVFCQSGIKAAGIDLALEAERQNLHTVAFTSMIHSRAANSQHPSGKKLFEVCRDVVDLGGVVGDAVVSISDSISGGPLSLLGGVFLAHTILVAAMRELENQGIHCCYASGNTPEGEERNKRLEQKAKQRDPLLRVFAVKLSELE